MRDQTLDSFDPDEVARLFSELLEHPPAAFAAALASATVGRPALRRELGSLLGAHQQAATFLESPPIADLLAVAADHRAPEIGDRIGPYRLAQELGRGGMGAVFRGEREDGGFEQHVALKVIGQTHGFGMLHERFLRERHILARLTHPNISRLLDGGMTADGQPWFAMELVSGKAITEWCDDRRATLDERVRLFIQGCRAVQHAHSKLVIHRDLKPSNIFVADDGTLKLLDFGIAKLFGGDEDGALTRAGSPLTRDYAAPEQLLGEPATTATDVYSLGVVLHELLTGSRPPPAVGLLDPEGEDASRTSPPRTIGSAASIDVPAAAARRSTPTNLRSALAPDLDAILRQALHPAPDRRYATVEALGQDLQRWRDGLPIQARRPSLRDRLGKLVRRHRAASAATLAAVLALLGGLLASLWQADIAAHERDAARRAARRAEEVQTFLVDLFEGADPAEAKGEEITARELLERGIERVDRELEGQPEAQADLLHTIGRISRSLGAYERARKLAQREVELRREIGTDRRALATALNARGNAEVQLGEVAAAEATYRSALAIRRELLGASHPEVAESLNDLAIALVEQSRYGEAEPLYHEALAMQRSLLGEQHRDVATTISNLATLHWHRHEPAEAEALSRQALAIWRATLDPDHPLVAQGLGDLSMVRRAQGAYEEAEALGREALAIQRRVLGPRHPSVSTRLNNLAAVLRDQGDDAGAEELLLEVVAIDREQLGATHPWLAISLDNLASALAGQDRDAEALPLFEEALAIHLATRGADHPRTATSLRRQAETLAALGRIPQALELAERALEVVEARSDPGDPALREARGSRARVRWAAGRLAAAEEDYRAALAADTSAAEPGPGRVLWLLDLGELVLTQGRTSEARSLLGDGLRLADSELPLGHPLQARARSLLGHAMLVDGQAAAAAPFLQAGWEGLRASLGERHRNTVAARTRLDQLPTHD